MANQSDKVFFFFYHNLEKYIGNILYCNRHDVNGLAVKAAGSCTAVTLCMCPAIETLR